MVLRLAASLAIRISPFRSILESTYSMGFSPTGWQLTNSTTRSRNTPKWILCHSVLNTWREGVEEQMVEIDFGLNLEMEARSEEESIPHE